MFVKDNVRQRRQNRIKTIVDENQDELYHPMDDPEYVWKLKRNAWDENRGREEAVRWKEWNTPPKASQVRNKFILCILLFAIAWGIFQVDHPWAVKGQGFIVSALTEDFDFKEAAVWYAKIFQGSPSFIPTFDKNNEAAKVDAQIRKNFFSPADGVLKVPFDSTTKGIQLETKPQSPVVSLDTGRVIYVGKLEETGLTVIIQHANQLQSVYGWIGQTSLKVNDWVKGGQSIGNAAQHNENGKSILYFAIRKENQYINPADVIAFD